MKSCTKNRKIIRIGDLSLMNKFKTWNCMALSVAGFHHRVSQRRKTHLQEASKPYNIVIPESSYEDVIEITDESEWSKIADLAEIYDVYRLAYFEEAAANRSVNDKLRGFSSSGEMVSDEEKQQLRVKLGGSEILEADAANKIVEEVMKMENLDEASPADKIKADKMLEYCTLLAQANLTLAKSRLHQTASATFKAQLLDKMDFLEHRTGYVRHVKKASEISLISKFQSWEATEVEVKSFKGTKDDEVTLCRDFLDAFGITVDF